MLLVYDYYYYYYLLLLFIIIMSMDVCSSCFCNVDSLERQVEAMYVEHAQQLEQKDEEHIHQEEEVEALKIKLEVLVK